MMKEIVENAPVYSLLPWIKIYQTAKSLHCVIPFGLGKENLNILFTSSELYFIFLLI